METINEHKEKLFEFAKLHPYVLSVILVIIILTIFFFVNSYATKTKRKSRKRGCGKGDEDEVDKLIESINRKQQTETN